MTRFRGTSFRRLLAGGAILAGLCGASGWSCYAGPSAFSTWVGGGDPENPTDWGLATNWTGAGVPVSTAYEATFGSEGSTGLVHLGSSDRSIGGFVFNSVVNTTITTNGAGNTFSTSGAGGECYITVNGGSHAIDAKLIGNGNLRIRGTGDLILGKDVGRTNATLATFSIGNASAAANTYNGTVTFLGGAYAAGIEFGDSQYLGRSALTLVIGGDIGNRYGGSVFASGMTIRTLAGSHQIKDTSQGSFVSSIAFEGPGDLVFTHGIIDNGGPPQQMTYTMNGPGKVSFAALDGWQRGMGLIKAGSGVMEIQGAGSYTGDTTINAGMLALGAAGSVASTSIVLNAGGVLDVTAKDSFTMAETVTYTFGMTPSGAGAAGRIDARGLNISAAHVVFEVQGALNDPLYVLANYVPPLTGEKFASVVNLPNQYVLDYSYHGNQIVLRQDPYAGVIVTVH